MSTSKKITIGNQTFAVETGKVAKQADVLMLFYVIAPEKVSAILNGLGYQIDDIKKYKPQLEEIIRGFL